MAESDKSFLSGVHLLITTLAALATAGVAVFGLALTQGWLGGKSTNTSTSTSSGSSTSSNGSSTTSGSSTGATVPQFVVDPPSITFGPLTPMTASLTITNTGSVALPDESQLVTGAAAGRFSTDPGTCGGPVQPGQSCRFQVTFHPQSGSSNATLVVDVGGGAQEARVPITASSLL